jgi:hypothetical protein
MLEDEQESGQENQDGGQSQQEPDYKREAEEYRAKLERLAQDNESYKRDLQSHKEELSQRREDERRSREDERRRSLLLAGDKELLQEEEQRRSAEKIKEQFFKVFPNAKNVLEGNGQNQQQGEKEVSVAEQAFHNGNRQRAMEMAKKSGFGTTEGQQVMTTVGDYLINITPQWKERYYKRGDTTVIDEVHKWMEDKVFAPRDRAVEARLLEKLKKQGRYTAPLPSRTGGSNAPSPSREKDLDLNVPNQRKDAFLKVARSSMGQTE